MGNSQTPTYEVVRWPLTLGFGAAEDNAINSVEPIRQLAFVRRLALIGTNPHAPNSLENYGTDHACFYECVQCGESLRFNRTKAHISPLFILESQNLTMPDAVEVWMRDHATLHETIGRWYMYHIAGPRQMMR